MLNFTKDFNPKKRKQVLFGFSLLFLFFVLLPRESISQSKNSPPLITRVSVRIDGLLNGKDIGELIPVKEGEPYSLKKINSSIKQIYKTGLFSDIQVLKEGKQEIHLIFLLTRRLFARRIIFKSIQKFPLKRLKEGLFSLREGGFFTEEKLVKAVEELKEALRKEGFFHPEVKAYTKRDPRNPSIDVFFEIQSTKKFIIKKIAFSGDRILSEAELKKKMRSKQGELYIPSILEEDITRLKEVYNLMGYQRAEVDIEEISFDEKKRRVSISLKISPHERIEIVVKGAQVPLSLLRPIWEARIFEEWGLAEGEAKIIGYLRKKGNLFSSIRSFIKKADDEIRVVYNVTLNEKCSIRDISFEGMNYFTSSQLEDELDIGKRTPFLSWIDGERLFELPEEIESFYKTGGFPNARVDLTFHRQGKKVKAIFHIEEGSQEKIKKLSFEGAHLFSQKTLLEQISSFEGGPFFQLSIQKDIEKLENFYLNQGIRGTEIRARIERISGDFFSVVFSLREGERVRIGKIVITGNVVTKRKTILKELRIKEGEYARFERISESKRRLERLGIFTKVKIEEIPLSPDTENLVVSVREGERNYAGLGIGLETKSEPQSFAIWNNILRPRGTAELIRSNILGSAAQLSLVGQFSLKEKRGVLSWEQPYFFGLPLQTYLNAWLEREERTSFSYDRQGISLTAIKPISEDVMVLMTLRWAETTLRNLLIEESEVDRQHRPFSATSISGSFIWDRRNDPFNPGRGSFLSFVFERAFPIFKAESDYLKSFLKYQHFIPIFSRVTFSATSRLGMGGGRIPIPIHERFFGGGSNSFRGEKFDELGPKDPTSLKPVGGEALLLLNFELTFPLLSAVKDLYGAVFYDKGNVFDEIEHFTLNALQDAIGFGIRYRTPLGPVRLEIGWNLDKPRRERKALVFITLGNVF